MDETRFLDALRTVRLGRVLTALPVVESTNDLALQAIRDGSVVDGAVFLAGRQTHGRGTHDRQWFSNHDEGLWYSLVVMEPLPVAPLSFLPGIALVEVLVRHYQIDAHLKWPNDVLVDDRKLAGFLVESQQMPDGRTAWVIGCGINVNQRSFESPIQQHAVSMRLCTGQGHGIDELLRHHLEAMERLWLARADLVDLWPRHSRMPGRWVRAELKGRSVVVLVLGLSAEGHLLVQHEDGQRQVFVSHSELNLTYGSFGSYEMGGERGQLGPGR